MENFEKLYNNDKKISKVIRDKLAYLPHRTDFCKEYKFHLNIYELVEFIAIWHCKVTYHLFFIKFLFHFLYL